MSRGRKIGAIAIGIPLVLIVLAAFRFGFAVYLEWRDAGRRVADINAHVLGKAPDFLPPAHFPASAIVPEGESWIEGELGFMVAEALLQRTPKKQVFSADGRYLAIAGVGASYDPMEIFLEIHDLPTHKLIRRFRLGNREVLGLRFSPSGRRLLVSLGSDFQLKPNKGVMVVLDIPSGTCDYASTSSNLFWMVDDNTLIGEVGGFYTIDIDSGTLKRFFRRRANVMHTTWLDGRVTPTFRVVDILPQRDEKTVLAYGYRHVGDDSERFHVERWNWQTGTMTGMWEPFPASADTGIRALEAADRPDELLLISGGNSYPRLRLQQWRLSLATGEVTALPDIESGSDGRDLAESFPFAEHPAAIGISKLGTDIESPNRFLKVGTDGRPPLYLATLEAKHTHLISPDGSLLFVADDNGAKIVPTTAPGETWYLNGPRPDLLTGLVHFSRGGQYEIIRPMKDIIVRPTLGQDPAAFTEPAPRYFAYISYPNEGDGKGGWIERHAVRIRDMQPVGYNDREIPVQLDEKAIGVEIRDDGTRLAILLVDGRVMVCDSEGLNLSEVALPGVAQRLTALPGDGGFLVGDNNGTLTRCTWQGQATWSTKVGKAFTYLPPAYYPETVGAVSADGTVAAVTVDSRVARIDLATGEVLSRTPDKRAAGAACLSADGSRLTCQESLPTPHLAMYDSGQSTEEPITVVSCGPNKVLLADRGDRILVSTRDRRVSYLSPDDLHLIHCASYADPVAGAVGLRTGSAGDGSGASAVIHELGLITEPWRGNSPEAPSARVILEGLRSGDGYSRQVREWTQASNFRERDAWWQQPAPTDILCTFADRGRQVRLTRADDPQANGVLMLFNDYEWLFFTPDGRFDGSDGVARHLVRPTTTSLGLQSVASFTMDSPQRVPGLLHATLRLPLPEATPKAE